MNADTRAPFERAKTLADALAFLAEHSKGAARPVLLAGGTDWTVEQHLGMHGGTAPDAPVVDVSAVAELASIRRAKLPDGRAGWELGAGVTYLALRRHAELAREVPLLAAMAREVGAIQIQARGTLAGNLATGSPAADGVPALMALGSVLILESKARGRREVEIEKFYTGYKRSVLANDELIAAVRFATPGAHWFWRKVGTRQAQSISKVGLAATARVENNTIADARFGMSSVAATIATLPTVRGEMLGKKPGELDVAKLVAALGRDIKPIDDVRSTGEYRMHVAGRLVELFATSLQGR